MSAIFDMKTIYVPSKAYIRVDTLSTRVVESIFCYKNQRFIEQVLLLIH